MSKNNTRLWQVTIDNYQKGILLNCKPESMSKSSFLREVVIPAYLRSVHCPKHLVEKF